MRVSISPHRVQGTVLQWCGRYGWIQPSVRIEHDQAALNGGRVFIHRNDLPTNTHWLIGGAQVSFLPYADGKGLGAEALLLEAQDSESAAMEEPASQLMGDVEMKEDDAAEDGETSGNGKARGVQKTIQKPKTKMVTRGGKGVKGKGKDIASDRPQVVRGKGGKAAGKTPTCIRDKTSHEGGGGDLTLRWACSEMQGWRPAMEDAHCAVLPLPTPLEAYALFGVFDGHGGSQVSRIVADELPEVVHKCATSALEELRAAEAAGEAQQQTLIERTLSAAFPELDAKLRSQGDGQPCELAPNLMPNLMRIQTDVTNAYSLVGSTAVVAAIESDLESGRPLRITVANAGDSRALLCRSGTAIPLSEDHKPESPVEKLRIENAGGSVALVGPCYRVDGWGLNLSRALGDFHYKARDDLPPSEQKVSSCPDVQSIDLTPEDEFLLLCCDGVFELLSDQDAVDAVRQGLDKGLALKEILEGLVDSCAAENPLLKGGKGTDNVSAMAILLTGARS